MFTRLFFSAFVLLLLVKAPAASATVIGTSSTDTTARYFGTYATPTFGQTMTSTGDTLTSLTFSSINVYFGSNARLVIAPLTGDTVGKALYSSQYSLSDGSNTFANLGISTTVGAKYLAYLTTLGVKDDPIGLATFGASDKNSYSGGDFVYGTEDCALSQTFSRVAGSDLGFSANFVSAVAVTPEPSSLMLLATGLASAGTMLRRRRNLAA